MDNDRLTAFNITHFSLYIAHFTEQTNLQSEPTTKSGRILFESWIFAI